jgi:hypothetical protein
MFRLFMQATVLLLGTNTSEYPLSLFLTGTLSSKLILVGASIVYLEALVLPFAL